MLQVAGVPGSQGGVVHRAGSTLGRFVRFVAALLLAVPVVAGAASSSVSAVTNTLVPTTAWEVDGNAAVDGNGGVANVSLAGDWGNDAGTSWTGGTYGPGLTPGVAPTGAFPSTGSYYLWRDMDACNSLSDTIGVGGDKVDDGPVWPVITGSAPNKADVRSVSLAAEKVDVGGQINDIVYAAFELCQDSGGSFNASLFFDDGDGVSPSAGDNGDYIIIFDFQSDKVGEGTLFKRIGGVWVEQSRDATKIETFATGLMGEAAVNLTTLGILPGAPDTTPGAAAGVCRTISIGGQVASIAGYSTGSQIKDLVNVTPLDLSNCGPLNVKKVSNATDSTTEFGYDVFQNDLQPAHDTTLGVTGGAITTEPDVTTGEIDATINVGETHMWTNVISQPDYKITEDTPPTGWDLVSISCTYPNIFAAPVGGVYPTATSVIYNGAYTNAMFLVPPSFIDLGGASPVTLPAAECTITNNVTGIKIVKTGAGDASTLFPFADNSATPNTAALTIADNPATTTTENSTTFAYPGGTSVVITETIPTASPAWALTSIACLRADGITPVGTVNLPAGQVTVTTVAGEVITCTYTNIQQAAIIIDKVTVPTGSTASFDFNASWDAGTDPDFSLTDAADPASFSLPPNPAYTVTEVAQDGWKLTAATCTDGSPVDLATGVASIDLAAGEVVTCTYTNSQRGAVTVTKTASAATPVPGAPTQWDVVYTVDVTSASQIAEMYDLVDSFHFGTGITVVSTSATGPSGAIAGFTGAAPTNVLADDVSIPALGMHTYTVEVRVDVAGSSADRDCDQGDPETGTLNTATVTSQGASLDASDCALIPNPNITVAKTVIAEPVRNTDGTLTIVYGIDVTNAAGAGNGTYNVVDTFGFGSGISVVSKAITASPAGVTVNPAYASTPADDTIATGVVIGPGLLTHHYEVTVTVSVVAAPTTDGDCSADDPSTGLLNTVVVTVDGHTGDDDSVCRPVSTLTLVKAVTNNDGGNLTPSQVTLTAMQGGSLVLSGTGTVGGAVLPGDYALAEAPFPSPGYTAGPWVCVSGPANGSTVTVAAGANVVCTITNDDKPVDLKLTKDDAGASPILGGSFNYTLTISNIGSRDPDAGEPIVVTDELPAGLLFGAPLPAGCTTAGQTMTCVIPAADLGAGESVVLTIPVTVSLSATPGTFTNKAWVTTNDDPATLPPACPVAASWIAALSNPTNNVDCEDTPVREVADLAIVKTASTAAPGVGQSFDWVLTVTNLGPNVAKSVEITDVVPASLVVTAVASSDFTCTRAGNAVTCGVGTLAVGASGTIRITVQVPVGTPGGVGIVNVGNVTGSVFDPNLSNNTSQASVLPVLPEVEPPVVTVEPEIPETGGDPSTGLNLGMWLMLLGGAALLVARRGVRRA